MIEVRMDEDEFHGDIYADLLKICKGICEGGIMAACLYGSRAGG